MPDGASGELRCFKRPEGLNHTHMHARTSRLPVLSLLEAHASTGVGQEGVAASGG